MARGIGPRPPEIFEAEMSIRSQGTSRKDLILSERDEFQGCVVPEPEPAVGFHTAHHVVGAVELGVAVPGLGAPEEAGPW